MQEPGTVNDDVLLYLVLVIKMRSLEKVIQVHILVISVLLNVNHQSHPPQKNKHTPLASFLNGNYET